jgi:hypothetical protein
MKFEMLTAVTMKNAVVLDVARRGSCMNIPDDGILHRLNVAGKKVFLHNFSLPFFMHSSHPKGFIAVVMVFLSVPNKPYNRGVIRYEFNVIV